MKHTVWGCLIISSFVSFFAGNMQGLAPRELHSDAQEVSSIEAVVQRSMDMWTKIDLMKAIHSTPHERTALIVVLIDNLLAIYREIEELAATGQLLLSDEYLHISSILEHIRESVYELYYDTPSDGLTVFCFLIGKVIDRLKDPAPIDSKKTSACIY